MAYSVTLYSFSKKHNSTKIPTGGTPISCKLKDDSSILNPVLVVDFSNLSVTPQNFNYAYIAEFNRYYWINDIAYIRGLWEFSLSVDVLASWKSQIGSLDTYIFRMDNGNSFSDFIDGMYTYTTAHETVNSFGTNPFATSITDGTYILGITGQGGGVGGVTYVAMSAEAFNALANQMFSNTNWLNITDITSNLQKALINPMQYIQSIQWFPLSYNSCPGKVKTNLNFAWWTFNQIAHKELVPGANGTWYTGTFTIPVPKHGAYSTYGREMLLAPATHYTAIILPFGQWDIDPLNLVNTDNMQCNFICDLITGQAFLLIGSYEYDGDAWHTRWFDSRQAQIGVAMSINQITQDITGIAGSAVAGAAAIASGGATAVLGALGATVNIADRIAPKSSTSGGRGNTAFYNLNPRIIAEFLLPGQRDHSLYGVPRNAPGKPNQSSGYVQCQGVFDGPCTDAERMEINSYMESGFFYE